MSAPPTRELLSAPSLPALYARAVLPKRGVARELPTRRLVLRDQRVHPPHLERYAKVCGFHDTSQLPATYPHLAAFAPSMALLTARDFPFPLLGLVHIANQIERLRPVLPTEALTYQVWAEGLRPHARGTAFDIRTQVDDGTATVWRSTSTYLRRDRPRKAGSLGPPAPPEADTPSHAAPREEELARRIEDLWDIPGSVGRSYASVSGDRNPIHLHTMTAKPFGFRRALAHGMWSKARCLAVLEGELPDAYRVQVAFRQPVLLPARVRFAADLTPTGWRFTLRGASGSERRHLCGTVSALS